MYEKKNWNKKIVDHSELAFAVIFFFSKIFFPPRTHLSYFKVLSKGLQRA